MNNRRKVLEWVLDGLTILVVIILAKSVVTRYLPSSRAKGAALNTIEIGSTLNLDNVDWTKNKSTLVMALQTGCRWCEASMSFYKDIIHSNASGSFHVVALFPQTIPEAKEFLHRFRLDEKVTDVRQAKFGDLGISATPTLVLLDQRGRVLTSWVGKLSPEEENKVFDSLKVRRLPSSDPAPVEQQHASVAGNVDADLLNVAQFLKLRAALSSLPIIDVAPRPVFEAGHIDGALNIPLDEIEDRAVHEVPWDTSVIVYCNYCTPCEKALNNSQGFNSNCSIGRVLLQDQGFSHLKILAADLNELARAGVKVKEDPKSKITQNRN